MGIFIKTNDIFSETEDVFDGSHYTALYAPVGNQTTPGHYEYEDCYYVSNTRAGYLYVRLNNKLYMFRSHSWPYDPNYYELDNFYAVYDLSAQYPSWQYYRSSLTQRPLPEILCQPYKSIYLASDSNRIYFCLNGGVTSNPSTGGSEYKKYDHYFYGYDFENNVINYTNKIGETIVNGKSLDAIEEWNIKDFSSDSILLNGAGVTNSSGTYSSNTSIEQQKLTLLSYVEDSTISTYTVGDITSIRSSSWMYPHKLYDDGYEVWLSRTNWYYRKGPGYVTVQDSLPSTYDSSKFAIASATFLTRDQLHFFYYSAQYPYYYQNGYYHTYKTNNQGRTYKWVEGDKSRVDGVYSSSYSRKTLTLFYTFEYDGTLYSISRSWDGYSKSVAHFRKIYFKDERTYNDGTHGKIKGIWIRVKKMIQDANGNYEIVEDSNPKRVTNIWIRNGNSYEKILW